MAELDRKIGRQALEIVFLKRCLQRLRWPRITAELKRRGWEVNHKRVYRIMQEDNLLCLRRDGSSC